MEAFTLALLSLVAPDLVVFWVTVRFSYRFLSMRFR